MGLSHVHVFDLLERDIVLGGPPPPVPFNECSGVDEDAVEVEDDRVTGELRAVALGLEVSACAGESVP
jgi:hypothetical protein